MNLKTAKDYFEMGVLTGFDAVRDPMASGWLLVVSGKQGKSWTLHTALNSPKVYSTLDSLTTEVERITGRVSSVHYGI